MGIRRFLYHPVADELVDDGGHLLFGNIQDMADIRNGYGFFCEYDHQGTELIQRDRQLCLAVEIVVNQNQRFDEFL